MMKPVVLIILMAIILIPVSGFSLSKDTELILDQIKQTNKRIEDLREDMNKRFEQVDKRFEQVDKRFEQVEKRFEFIQLLLIALLGVVIGGTLYNIIQDRKIPKNIDLYIEKTRTNEIMVKEIAARDPQLLEHFKSLGLL